MELNYTNYIKVNELLALIDPRSEEHDEVLFIVIHQTYELWFKLLLHELDKTARDLEGGDLYGAIATVKRARTVMKTLVGQMDILETMTPLSFSSFRDRLESASGFQSVQYRELEFALGYKRPDTLQYYQSDSEGLKRLQARLQSRSLIDSFYLFLEKLGLQIPNELKQKKVEEANVSSPELQKGLITLYRERKDVAILLELMTEFDEGLQEWRDRHVKLVERTIGNKQGTGGSLGVEFLKRSLFKPIFPDLWEIRHEF